MTILPKNKQAKASSSGSGCNNNAPSGTSTVASVSSSVSASNDPSGGVTGSSGLGSVVVGVPVSLTGSKRSREVASSVDPGASSGSSDPSGPSSGKRRHYHHRSGGDQTVAGSSDHSDRRSSDHRRHHGINPYLHLAKKVSGKTPASTCPGSSDSTMIVGTVARACSSTTLSVPVGGVSGSSNDVGSNIVGGNSPGPIVVAAPPGHLDLSGMSTSSGSDLSGAGGEIVCGAQESNGNVSSVSSAGHLSPPGSPTGYNSGDEYATNESGHERGNMSSWTPEQQIEAERRFEKKLRKKGYIIAKMGEDGACLFRAVADQVYGDQDMHGLVRKLCCDYMMKNSDYFSQYVTEDFNGYVSRKRRDHIQGNHVELQALSEMFARPIEVYHYNTEPINIFQSGQDDEMMMDANDEPIRLSYHSSGLVDSGHYNSVRSARVSFKPKATLIHYTPPQVLESAIRSSESDALEKAMLEDKLRASDWEATNEALEEQVARESYLEWVRETEQRRRRGSGTSGTTTTGSALRETSGGLFASTTSTITKSPSQEGGNSSPKAGGSGSYNDMRPGHSDLRTSNHSSPAHKSAYTSVDEGMFMAEGSTFHRPNFQGAETEREILARVLLESRQEYLDHLKAKKYQKEQHHSQQNQSSFKRSKSPNYHAHSQVKTRSTSSRSSSPSTSSSSCYKESTPPPSTSRRS